MRYGKCVVWQTNSVFSDGTEETTVLQISQGAIEKSPGKVVHFSLSVK